jgi:hypothetical protein
MSVSSRSSKPEPAGRSGINVSKHRRFTPGIQ